VPEGEEVLVGVLEVFGDHGEFLAQGVHDPGELVLDRGGVGLVVDLAVMPRHVGRDRVTTRFEV